MKIESRDISLCDIHETHLLLRMVERESLEYVELRDSIAANGPLNSICVRPSPRIAGKWEIVDGMYRYTIFNELGYTTVPCVVRDMSDVEVVAAQIQANAIRPTTKPTDFARQLKKLLDANPGLSQAGLQAMIHKSPAWISEQLGLLRLVKPVQKMVDRGEIPLMSAYMLSRVFPTYQTQLTDFAKTAPAAVFKIAVAEIIKRQREAARQGKLDVMFDEEFKPTAYLRTLRDILDEKERPEAGPMLLAVTNARTAMDGWLSCLVWVSHLDAKSVEEQRGKLKARMRKTFAEETEPCNL